MTDKIKAAILQELRLQRAVGGGIPHVDSTGRPGEFRINGDVDIEALARAIAEAVG